MPSNFCRFRYLNGGSRIRNEGDKPLYVRAFEEDEPLIIHPGMEMNIPQSPEGETIVDVLLD